ncbi:MAG: zinc ABC transporter substrate-binding protein [Saprospiraceae bacterium]|nr:zinc ABC transporter substrate-binding protein [Saprospiraceae bacterium]
MTKATIVHQIKIYGLAVLFLGSAAALYSQDKPLVVSTASIFSDMAEVIGGNLVEVQSIVPIGGDPHIYEPTPANAQLVNKADLVIMNGLTFEGWLNELVENSGTKASVKLITEGINPISSEKYQNSSDPHAWMDAKNGLIYIENIKNALIELDPDHEQEYTFNYELYKQQIEDLDQEIETQINSIPAPQRILITSHDAFRYYGQRYGIKVEAVLGTSTDAEVQTSDMVRLNKVIKSSKVPAVFIETTVNPKLLQQLANDNDIEIGGLLYSDSIGDKESPAPTYLDMLRYNTKTIVEALSRELDLTAEKEEPSSMSNYILYGVLGVLLVGGFLLLYRRLNQV